MTDTADPTTLSVDERAASARGFFDVDPVAADGFPPPPPPMSDAGRADGGRARHSAAADDRSTGTEQPTPFAFSPSDPFTPAPPASRQAKRKGGGGRRFVSWLIVLAVIGGGVYAGITYGPDLLDRDQG